MGTSVVTAKFGGPEDGYPAVYLSGLLGLA